MGKKAESKQWPAPILSKRGGRPRLRPGQDCSSAPSLCRQAAFRAGGSRRHCPGLRFVRWLGALSWRAKLPGSFLAPDRASMPLPPETDVFAFKIRTKEKESFVNEMNLKSKTCSLVV